MLGILKKKIIDEQAAMRFWKWFEENEDYLIEKLKTNDPEIVWAIDEVLAPVFPYFKQDLEFQLGFHKNEGELFLFHLNDQYLKRDFELLEKMMPKTLEKRWTLIIEA